MNDAFVMGAWGDAQGVDGEILMIADPEAAFTRAMGLATDASAFGLGTRSARCVAIVEDGGHHQLSVETHIVDHAVTTAEVVLADL